MAESQHGAGARSLNASHRESGSSFGAGDKGARVPHPGGEQWGLVGRLGRHGVSRPRLAHQWGVRASRSGSPPGRPAALRTSGLAAEGGGRRPRAACRRAGEGKGAALLGAPPSGTVLRLWGRVCDRCWSPGPRRLRSCRLRPARAPRRGQTKTPGLA